MKKSKKGDTAMKNRRFKVGIFDSGIGGLTVLNACARTVPRATFYYYGDNLRAPYGNRSEEEITSFSREALLLFQKIKTDAVVIACNTATAAALPELRREFPMPIIGMEPAVKPAAKSCKNVLVLATERTAKSARMSMLLGRFPDCNFTVHACPQLALAVEKYFTQGERFLLSAHLPEGKFDGVVLGCSHYSFFARQISAHYSAPVFDGNTGVAKRLNEVLSSLLIGQADHYLPTSNSGDAVDFRSKNRIKFLGKSRKTNKNVYFRTYVF